MRTGTIEAMHAPEELGAEGEERLRLALAAGRVGSWELNLRQEGATDAARTFQRGQTSGLARGSERFGGSRLVPSPELCAMVGVHLEGFDGRLEPLLAQVHPADRRALTKAFRGAIRLETDAEAEIRFTKLPGPTRWLLIRGRWHREVPGGPGRLLGVAIDITARKTSELEMLRVQAELEHKLASRTTQLRATTDELDAFCYSVSHDLRAPLRSIRGFNEVLLERYSARLDPRGQEFLRRACESSYSMDRLIDDLLKLSRVSRVELAKSVVDLSQLAAGLADSLRAAEPDRRATFEVSPGLRALGDERLLKIVLENLLGNAWKFSSKRADARIAFGLAKAPQEAFFVRDNGVGFEPSYGGRLFGLFQRLHAGNEFAGAGTGLAIVQRIINRHGGRVWAEGAVDQGATFYFSLPNNEIT